MSKNSPQNRPAIPANVAIALRQEACFGCCKCGNPIIQYHHIVEYSEDPHFRPADMMVLCPACHEFVTHAKVSEDIQREWKSKPYNSTYKHPGGLLYHEQKNPEIRLGNVLMRNCPLCLVVDEECIIGMRQDETCKLLLSLRLYDVHEKLLVSIDDNEWKLGEAAPWDMEAKWRYFRLRQKAGEILLEVDARIEPVFIRGVLRKSGRVITITDSQLEVADGNNRVVIQGGSFSNFRAGVCIDRRSHRIGCNII